MTALIPPEDHRAADQAPAAVTVEAEVICGQKFYSCMCDRPLSHDGPHVCGRDGGSWHRNLAGQDVIDALPDLRRAFGTATP
jgi:hypothetical protein